MCVVNVQHNCAAHICVAVRDRVVRQEREVVLERASIIKHEQPDDLVLNCAQMRSHRYVQHFYNPLGKVDRESSIHEGAIREFNTQKAKKSKEAVARKSTTPSNADTLNSASNGNRTYIPPLHSPSLTATNPIQTPAHTHFRRNIDAPAQSSMQRISHPHPSNFFSQQRSHQVVMPSPLNPSRQFTPQVFTQNVGLHIGNYRYYIPQ